MTIAPELLAARVADLMITRPKTLPADASVADARAELDDGHVHLVLLVCDGLLRGTIARDDVPTDAVPTDAVPTDAAGSALTYARLAGRIVGPDDAMAQVHPRLVATGLRRLVVVDDAGRLLGLLCLKHNGTGYCTDEGVAARAADPGVPGTSPC